MPVREDKRIYRQLKGIRKELKLQAKKIENELSKADLTKLDVFKLKEFEEETDKLVKTKTRLRKRFQQLTGGKGPYSL
ncbi:MAG: hypothetical protein DRJ31_07140 [Candidatus Methanomethylicota archaeon]|uniref:Uncharacterized protein n=1 Tax=Thermoproteota archaeon TaxID=2056631 RepID=A0A497F2Z5_9CREN|nr:MAG: hypothetical protein DRJ31_07140 [Candidatus Verstraetearchaeota archaeon]RLE53318.1 MAG: hypothetical protein DRJ33_01320 [Candidatus Verstraetearchaeota archaeon]